ncbi:MAG: FecR family protein [Candidatus Wallbacteria bacterium]|nr:FecR family protein [Candidatus Wallbacteria bacterium]
MAKRLILLVIGILFLTQIVYAEDEFPNRTFLKEKVGMVRVKKAGGDWVKADDNMDLAIGDMVKTLSNGKAEVVLSGTAVIRVKPDSEFIIPESKANTKEKVSFIQMIKGTLWAKAKKEDDSLKVATPNAICGVRGTEFIIEVTRDLMRLTVTNGSVAFVPLLTGVTPKPQLVQAGQQMSFVPSIALKAAEAEKKKMEEKKGEQKGEGESKKVNENAKFDQKGNVIGNAVETFQDAVKQMEEATPATGDTGTGNTGIQESENIKNTGIKSTTTAAASLENTGLEIQQLTQTVQQVAQEFTSSDFTKATTGTSDTSTNQEMQKYVNNVINNTTSNTLTEDKPTSGGTSQSGEMGQVKVKW